MIAEAVNLCRMPQCGRHVENRGLCHRHRRWLRLAEGHPKRLLAERHAIYLRAAPVRPATPDPYRAGAKVAVIAGAHGVSLGAVYKAVRKAGISLRNKRSDREESGPAILTPARLGAGRGANIPRVAEEAASAVAALAEALAWECPGCGWDSRQEPPRCPKCGQRETVQLRRPKSAPAVKEDAA